MRHEPPQYIVDLHCDEYTAQTEGRHAFLAWLEKQDLNIGDEILVPETGGGFSIWKRETTPKEKIN